MIVQPAFSTLLEMLASRSAARPSAPAFTYLQDGDVEGVRLTFAELERKARALAAVLQRSGLQGERALMLYSSSLEFVTAFFGCLYAGVIAVPAYPPKANQSFSRLLGIASDAAPRLALTTAGLISNLHRRAEQTAQFPRLEWLATDTVDADEAAAWVPPRVSPADLAFLQYTSGSTGSAKGVMVSHANLVHNLEGLRLRWEMTAESVMVTWLPTFHDLGLVFGVLEPLYTAAHCVMMSPTAFVQRPLRWLQAISRYRATHSLAPNFAYELAAGKITPAERRELDLASWLMALNAAEPVRETTIRRFTELFAPHGFRAAAFCPAYGLAEGTLHVSGLGLHDPPAIARLDALELGANRIVEAMPGRSSVAVVGCGPSAPGVDVAIVDPASRMACRPGEVGEIWVGGDSVAQGYWRSPDATAETFRATIAPSSSPEPRAPSPEFRAYLRTGDLGFIRAGQVYITGRLKDLIIVRGQNHYPQDLELTAEQSHPALRRSCSAAFSIHESGEEQLAVVLEVERTALRTLPADEVIANIRQAVAEEHDLQVQAVALVKPATIPKTSSGKIQRRACRAAFLDGTLELVAEWRQAAARPEPPAPAADEGVGAAAQSIRAWLIERIARDAGIPIARIDPSEPFSRYGMDSVAAVSLADDLERRLGCPVPAGIAYDYPNINALAEALAAAGREGPPDEDESRMPRPGSRPSSPEPGVPSHEAIAIIGMACRFPHAATPEAFWKLLHDGVDAVGWLPASRAALHGGPSGGPGAAEAWRRGAFLDQVDGFDAGFFGISPREAGSMDPQQRLLLETAWEALERGGVSPADAAGTRTGVFVGVSSNDYSRVQLRSGAGTDAWSGTGNALSIAANRLSYVLDLHGPSVAVDTACSSSLVAVHLACQSLRLGESELALAGGVNLMLSPEWSQIFAEAQMLSPGGRCRTFDASADGYVRGEGCAVVLLKPLGRALEDGDEVLAVIRGSAVNQDGRSNGLTAPNGPSQQEVVRRALDLGGIRPEQISYVEAHGTGTSLGDPIELESLAAVLGRGRTPGAPLRVGSVKTNIGHLEAAAGIAGLIKVVLAMQHRTIPPNLHFRTPNPHFPWDRHAIAVPAAATSWGEPGGSVYAGVSAFGFGGTNAHVVLEGAPPPERHAAAGADVGRGLLVLSARSPAALRALAAKYEDVLASGRLPWAAVCATASQGRTHWPVRAAVAGDTIADALPRLSAVAAGRGCHGAWQGEAISGLDERIAMIVPGQGAHWWGMGRDLYEGDATFRGAIDRCAAALAAELPVPLVDVLYGARGEELLRRTEYAQPAVFAVALGLMQVWARLGVRAAAFVGHSVGEFAAAVAAGALDVEEGCRLVAARGRLMQPLAGRMAVVWASDADVRALVAPYRDVAIAAINAPSQVVISGPAEDVAAITAAAKRSGRPARFLPGAHAFHSPLMMPMLASWNEAVARVSQRPPSQPWVSTVTGREVRHADPAYWAAQVLQPVQFASAIARLWERGCRAFVEVGASAGLASAAASVAGSATEGVWVSGLKPGRAGSETIREGVAQLYAAGARIDWRAWDPVRRARVVLPTYPFERAKYWIEEKGAPDAPAVPSSSAQAYEVQWEEIARAAEPPAADRPATVWVVCGGTAADTMAAVAAGLRTRGAVVAEAAPDQPALVRALEWAAARGLAGVVHIGGLDAPAADTALSADAVEQAVVESCLSLTNVVRAMAETPTPGARLWIVTRGAVAVEAADRQPAVIQAPLWGLGKAIGMEHPDLWGGLLDLDPDSDHPVRDLIDCLPLTPSEDQLAVRSGRTYAARLKPAPYPEGTGALPLRGDATYLITGGTGGLGLKMAARLVQGGARAIALVSRRGIAGNAPARRAIEAMERAGAVVRVFAADAGRERDLAAVLQAIDAQLPPLRGIVHAAGLLDDGVLSKLDRDRFERVCRPKVAGAWNLHRLTRGVGLDFFVLFSSAASLVGSAGQGNYAAANAFLDALAVSRSRSGLPALAINWGLWSGGGLGERVDALHRQRLAALGLVPIEEEAGLRVFDRLLGSEGQIAVVHADWSRYAAEYPRSSLVRGYAAEENQAAAAAGWLRDRLRSAEPAERQDLMFAFVREQTGAVLRCDPSQVAPRRGFFDQGMDSLLAMELRRRLEKALGVALPGTLTFDHPTTEGLGEYLLNRWITDAGPQADAPQGQATSGEAASEALAEIQKLTPGELEALIDRELDSLLP